jgi:hypothetical protein
VDRENLYADKLRESIEKKREKASQSFWPARSSDLLEYVYDDSACRHTDIRINYCRMSILELTTSLVTTSVVSISEGWHGAECAHRRYDKHHQKH